MIQTRVTSLCIFQAPLKERRECFTGGYEVDESEGDESPAAVHTIAERENEEVIGGRNRWNAWKPKKC
jgi:hypothetical protein